MNYRRFFVLFEEQIYRCGNCFDSTETILLQYIQYMGFMRKYAVFYIF
ncbi:hypothetical protein HMPREF1548_00318 [Clostridium sp. KLE 1755]|nr:hypothetical protein HMPREF1548_00318 [Clostridium sp. KLE 1755]